MGGVLPLVPLSTQLDEERKQAELTNNTPIIQGLSGHIRKCWTSHRTAKQNTVEERLLQCLRQKRGEYDPAILEEINKTGGSAIYMNLSSVKARAAASWLRDVLLGNRKEKPWSIDPTPIPELTDEIKNYVKQMALNEAVKIEMSGAQVIDNEIMREIVKRSKERAVQEMMEEAREAAERMELKMEDQLVEGGFQKALSEFIDDLTVFPTAILKGPVIRKRTKLVYDASGELTTEEALKLEWERVDPFMAYPAPSASDMDDGDFIERHKLRRSDLLALKGVPGYKDSAIDAVLEAYGAGGLHDWIWVDTAKTVAEGKSTIHVMGDPDTIEALQFWGSVQGKLLKEWGLEEVTDETAEYNVEAWLIGTWVIKAVLNPDPLARKPYYKASYEEIPGAWWGNSVMDLVRPSQNMCNAAARALANNMGIASGPQVVINVDRLPPGEDITQLYPWKIHQVTSDPFGSTAPPMDFFVPPSLAGELMQVYERFEILADSYSGIPRYMVGESRGSGGALSTASGASMMIQNAGKAMKQVVAYVDTNVTQPLIERLYQHNMRYSEDKDLKGDVNIVARGANALMVKEQVMTRRNELLQIALTSPVVHEIIGDIGIAELLREGAEGLEMDTDKIIPPVPVLRAKQAQREMMQMAAMNAQAQPQMGKRVKVGGGQPLMGGGTATNNFQDKKK